LEIYLVVLNLGSKREIHVWVVLSLEKTPPVPLNKRLRGPRVRSVAAEKGKIPVGTPIPGLLSSSPVTIVKGPFPHV